MPIPMLDLKGQYQQLKNDIDNAISSVLESCQFVLGPEVKQFEQECQDYLGVKHAITVGSGTDALEIALLAMGIGPGDEVIVPTYTFIATAEAVARVGAKPVFIDCDRQSFNLDFNQLDSLINDKTAAIIPVHLFGQPVDMQRLQSYNLKIVEDCAQSFGASIQDKFTGSLGDIGCFSFYPTKNLGCYGDGGLITTNDADYAEKISMLRNHGSEKRYYHDIVGLNSRLDEVQAAILRVKLPYINEFNQKRRQVAQYYKQALAGLDLTCPHEDDIGHHVYHQFTILSEQRDRIHQALAEAQIASAIFYPVPLHRQKAFANLSDESNCPNAERIAEQCLSLPMYPELTQAMVEEIAAVITKALARG